MLVLCLLENIIIKQYNRGLLIGRRQKSVSFFIDINFPLGMSRECIIRKKPKKGIIIS
jgi:hypothetical protein